MATFRRLTVVDQAEHTLGEMISAGELSGALPPVRSLAIRLGVSVPSLLQATQRLVAAGLLRKASRTGSYEVARGASKSAQRRKLLLIVTEAGAKDTPSTDRQTIEMIDVKLTRLDIQVFVERIAFGECKQPRKTWTRQLLRHHPSHVLFVNGNAAAKAWCESAGVQHAFLGASDMTTGDSIICIKMGRLINKVIEEFKAAGHRKVLVISHTSDASAKAWFEDRLAKAMETPLATVRDEEWVIRWPSGSNTQRRETLAAAIRRTQATGIFVITWQDYLLAQSILGLEGLRIPDDMSLVCLNYHEDMRWLMPAPAHFGATLNDFAKEVIDWVHTGELRPTHLTEMALQHWTPGESLAAARQPKPQSGA